MIRQRLLELRLVASRAKFCWTYKESAKDFRDAKLDEFDEENISHSDEEAGANIMKNSECEISTSDAMESCIEEQTFNKRLASAILENVVHGLQKYFEGWKHIFRLRMSTSSFDIQFREKAAKMVWPGSNLSAQKYILFGRN